MAVGAEGLQMVWGVVVVVPIFVIDVQWALVQRREATVFASKFLLVFAILPASILAASFVALVGAVRMAFSLVVFFACCFIGVFQTCGIYATRLTFRAFQV